MTRVFGGVKPTGHLTLGNYPGAVRRWAEVGQHRTDALFCVVEGVLRLGAEKARTMARPRVDEAYRAIGLLVG